MASPVLSSTGLAYCAGDHCNQGLCSKDMRLLELPAVYGRQARRVGMFSLIAFVLLFGGILKKVFAALNHLCAVSFRGRCSFFSLTNTLHRIAAMLRFRRN